jgi:hypothetical protein
MLCFIQKTKLLTTSGLSVNDLRAFRIDHVHYPIGSIHCIRKISESKIESQGKNVFLQFCSITCYAVSVFCMKRNIHC